jgi:hypothetical protein
LERLVQVVALSLEGNGMTDSQFVMLLRGLSGLGIIERVNLSNNKLTRTSVAVLLHAVVNGQAKQVFPLWPP